MPGSESLPGNVAFPVFCRINIMICRCLRFEGQVWHSAKRWRTVPQSLPDTAHVRQHDALGWGAPYVGGKTDGTCGLDDDCSNIWEMDAGRGSLRRIQSGENFWHLGSRQPFTNNIKKLSIGLLRNTPSLRLWLCQTMSFIESNSVLPTTVRRRPLIPLGRNTKAHRKKTT